MKTLFASFGWLLLLLPFISVAGTKTILNTINTSSEERQVSNFTGISSGGSYDVYVKMGNTEDLRIEGDEDRIKNIETKVENGILKIRTIKSANGWSWNNRGSIKIYITAKALNSLAVSGSGNMEVNGTVKANSFNTQVSGSGNIHLNVQCSTLNAAVSGSGGMKISGSTTAAHISISGSGGIDGRNLKTSTTDIKVSGSGNGSIHVEKQLNASVSGSGNISYAGNPKVNQSKSGSGSIHKI